MELEQLARSLAQQARQVQSELQELSVGEAASARRSTRPVESALYRIEQRLARVGHHTEQLLRRVPHDLESRIGQTSVGAGHTSPLAHHISPASAPTQPHQTIASLTPVEQKVFRLCFDGGWWTYRQMAERLDVVPTTVKNIVNRLLKDQHKQQLFRKRQVHGVAQVAVNEAIRRRILGARTDTSRKNGLQDEPHIALTDCL